MAQWTMCLTLDASHTALLEEVSHMIEDICGIPWYRPFKKRRAKQDMNLAYRLMEAFGTYAKDQDQAFEPPDLQPVA